MQTKTIISNAVMAFLILSFVSCSNDKPAAETATVTPSVPEMPPFNGYASQAEWGKHLVTVGGCNDCHTPKIMGPQGPIDDTANFLSGHSGKIPPPQVDRKMMESKGYITTADFTSWVGPWGISYAANLTPDSTGTGSWKEDQFIYALRTYTAKGLQGNRHMLPPMAMMPVQYYSDDELKAIFAYIRTVKPVHNIVPAPTPPASAKP